MSTSREKRTTNETPCKIVCPVACRSCDMLDCDDRMAEENTEEKVHMHAAQVACMTSAALYLVYDGKPLHVSNPWDDRTDSVVAANALQHCGMWSDFMCRHCHEEDCSVRKAPRTF